MKNLVLNNRNKEVAEKIPKRYVNSILNSVIAKSVDNGILFKELALYLSEKELQDIIDNLKIKIKQEKEYVYKPKIKQIKNDNEDLFFGFDD